jgi:hypothetical protein
MALRRLVGRLENFELGVDIRLQFVDSLSWHAYNLTRDRFCVKCIITNVTVRQHGCGERVFMVGPIALNENGNFSKQRFNIPLSETVSNRIGN